VPTSGTGFVNVNWQYYGMTDEGIWSATTSLVSGGLTPRFS
jgi:hypothetical protein